ncbi:sigma-54-dependent transcriptional regulator [Candidatus Venteria ishoeyi]|uniref:Transcriptional regulatory protein QseF n=1 Tax=Candidatus Venteria ishoeyi TaxID=1899563 RepID=A0A1H6FAT6_9GAMM|nr:sigma-54 dependent transcriptional regulator [Candidatus Venteria ishoeyi]MDM8548224.1 sigma-54 dependent transcriptional regulator [Candidatus Venteria ishoeyi]SEH06481.1 Transcriptional regulatory protein QseF [Candidatus Venteria ishoeyi]
MAKRLIAWLGMTDIRASDPQETRTTSGPIDQVLKAWHDIEAVELLADQKQEKIVQYQKWIAEQFRIKLQIHPVQLPSPTNFSAIYQQASTVLRELEKETSANWYYHLSPGTPAMAAIWIILAKTRFPAQLVQSSPQRGVEVAEFPFDLAADFLPDVLKPADARLISGSMAEPPSAPEFNDIIYRCPAMYKLITRAHKVALFSVPVLIQGESGTGKELLARAIHKVSPRHNKPFIAVNCGAIPVELVNSELFGHKKGAFTSAIADRQGCFETANGGTLFLDEIGELPLDAQVKLLRVIQEKEIIRVGENQAKPVDVRLISATNRILLDEIQQHRFREDLFHRLAVGILKLPPLRNREGDLSLLIDFLLKKINLESKDIPGYYEKSLTAAAKNLLFRYRWPGNIRELHNTLYRAAIWSDETQISEIEIRDALLSDIQSSLSDILERPFNDEFNIEDIRNEVTRYYLRKALDIARGKKSQAAKLLGLKNYQTLNNWIKKINKTRPL